MTSRVSWMPRRPIVLFGVLGAVIVLVLVTAAVFDEVWRVKSMPVQGNVLPGVSDQQLATVDGTRVFFGHQSVGENILGGVTAVYAARGMTAPPMEENGIRPGPDGGFIAHEFIGENEKPLSKIEDFDRALRGGFGDEVDVALMKLCFLDINVDTDVDALFATYRDTITGLERDFPTVTFVHVTVPLTTDSSFRNRVKIALGGSTRYGQGENVAREHYNELIRREYGSDRVFDIAAIESTAPDEVRQQHQYRDQPYFALQREYASDLGHLNETGSEVAAKGFLQSIAQASPGPRP